MDDSESTANNENTLKSPEESTRPFVIDSNDGIEKLMSPESLIPLCPRKARLSPPNNIFSSSFSFRPDPFNTNSSNFTPSYDHPIVSSFSSNLSPPIAPTFHNSTLLGRPSGIGFSSMGFGPPSISANPFSSNLSTLNPNNSIANTFNEEESKLRIIFLRELDSRRKMELEMARVKFAQHSMGGGSAFSTSAPYFPHHTQSLLSSSFGGRRLPSPTPPHPLSLPQPSSTLGSPHHPMVAALSSLHHPALSKGMISCINI